MVGHDNGDIVVRNGGGWFGCWRLIAKNTLGSDGHAENRLGFSSFLLCLYFMPRGAIDKFKN